MELKGYFKIKGSLSPNCNGVSVGGFAIVYLMKSPLILPLCNSFCTEIELIRT